ncbi:N-acetylmuramoyl-L-alanine amidase [Bradyrhizobium sp. 197]|uniref:peptidoglycan recognition protein family protein n=1 Tax=Bradyrhizobium sp. 197 TaxID=2782663 RepID=UPI001FFBB9B8|nr:peptidoglycan-binding domain-containing protein [Bradyrhizobium sp. 197]MCK1481028.1 N-acetylmuramoyl-L-alanine amidase [Bradyrhizobium sp. 197]
MVFSLTWLAEVLEDAGLKLAEQPGWRSRGRGEMGTVKGVICHHTAGSAKGIMPSLGVITNGRPDLAGPLAQLGLGRDGTFFVVAAGRCNHAGRGMWQGLSNGNANFIGIEAENTGLSSDPWPAVQMDAYRRGVAAILKKVGANSIMCCGHKEYALPHGRKDDPSFDMVEFRTLVATILAGTAPDPVIIPNADADGRPTLRRGARGDLVRQIQTDLKLPVDGGFGPVTEAALRQFQRDHDLVPDGIVGPRTWASLETLAAPSHVVGAAASAGVVTIKQLKQMAATSEVARFSWKDRGKAPVGYIKGMALAFGRAYCKFKLDNPAALDMARKNSRDQARDALAWYDEIFAAAGMSNDADGPDTLRHLFVLLTGLGMRESSGKFCTGRDTTADNTTADTAEAGLFQMSFDANSASPLLSQVFAEYKSDPSGFIDVFNEGVICSAADTENFGSGAGFEFQRLCKASPAFAAEYSAVALRHIRKHWGPIIRRQAQVRPECDALFNKIQVAIDASPILSEALLPAGTSMRRVA